MALFQYQLTGELESFLTWVDQKITSGSRTATLEDVGYESIGDAKLAVRVYERYSLTGSNRVSLTLSVLAWGNQLSVIAATSGGSAAVLFKLNTMGEDAFIEKARDAVAGYPGN